MKEDFTQHKFVSISLIIFSAAPAALSSLFAGQFVRLPLDLGLTNNQFLRLLPSALHNMRKTCHNILITKGYAP